MQTVMLLMKFHKDFVMVTMYSDVHRHTFSLVCRAARADPGFLKKGRHQSGGDAFATAVQEDDETMQSLLYSQGSCYTCHLQRPLRSKHCVTCDRYTHA